MSRPSTASIFDMQFDTEAAFNAAYTRRVKTLREARGLTQEEAATALGIPLDRYKKYEVRSPMPPYLLERFAALVGRDVREVLTGKPPKKARRGPAPESSGMKLLSDLPAD